MSVSVSHLRRSDCDLGSQVDLASTCLTNLPSPSCARGASAFTPVTAKERGGGWPRGSGMRCGLLCWRELDARAQRAPVHPGRPNPTHLASLRPPLNVRLK